MGEWVNLLFFLSLASFGGCRITTQACTRFRSFDKFCEWDKPDANVDNKSHSAKWKRKIMVSSGSFGLVIIKTNGTRNGSTQISHSSSIVIVIVVSVESDYTIARMTMVAMTMMMLCAAVVCFVFSYRYKLTSIHISRVLPRIVWPTEQNVQKIRGICVVPALPLPIVQHRIDNK